ncbi:YdeI/OmpD-associated family protein [Amycolatopsis sp. NPDC021455]|uniref:YdeI/OmpD-associated family protein n=1 Tax=Amycolatopsis sp. NPDC021455 TaxID=3154901 RepID=UPI0033DBDC94
MDRREFDAVLEADQRGHVRVRLPFNPSEAWGKKQRHFVRGSLNGMDFEGSLGSRGGEWFFPVNKALRASCGIGPGDDVHVVLEPGDSSAPAMPADLADALRADATAKSFFDSLSGFYRREYVTWIEGAKKEETRQSRVAEVIELLKRGRKQR